MGTRPSGARYRPRDYLRPGVRFGGSEWITPTEVVGDHEIARAKAARAQNGLCFHIRRRMEIEGVPMKELAKIMGTSYDHLGKVLRGHVIMTFEDNELANTILDRYQAGRESRERTRAISKRTKRR
jgi:hypothetical protein